MDPTTGRGKQLHLIQMLLLPFIPIMALITQNVVNMLTVLEHQYDMQESIDQVGQRRPRYEAFPQQQMKGIAGKETAVEKRCIHSDVRLRHRDL